MKILYVMPGVGVCGGTRVIWHHCLELAKLGHDTVYGVTEGPEEMTWLAGDVPVKHINKVKDGAWDVVVATGWQTWPIIQQSFPNARAKWGFVQMKESLFVNAPLPNAADRAFSLRGFHVFTISAWLKEYLERECHQRVLKVIPNGVDTRVFYLEVLPDPRPYKTDLPVALMVGHQASPRAKNLSDAASAIRRAGQFTTWHVCPFPPRSRSSVGADWVFVRPEQDLLRKIYSTADVLVMSSKAEGRTCIAPEAMACKCPVVIMDHRGTEDSQGGRALIAEPGDVGHLAVLIGRTMDNPEETKARVAKAYRYVKRKLRWDKIGKQLEKLYQSR